MDNKEKHRYYRKSEVTFLHLEYEKLSDPELYLLKTYGAWLYALSKGLITPTTESQREFLNLSQSDCKPHRALEILWVKINGMIEVVS